VASLSSLEDLLGGAAVGRPSLGGTQAFLDLGHVRLLPFTANAWGLSLWVHILRNVMLVISTCE
jgi:hypothetical protein